jgi:hypothetical protein
MKQILTVLLCLIATGSHALYCIEPKNTHSPAPFQKPIQKPSIKQAPVSEVHQTVAGPDGSTALLSPNKEIQSIQTKVLGAPTFIEQTSPGTWSINSETSEGPLTGEVQFLSKNKYLVNITPANRAPSLRYRVVHTENGLTITNLSTLQTLDIPDPDSEEKWKKMGESVEQGGPSSAGSNLSRLGLTVEEVLKHPI